MNTTNYKQLPLPPFIQLAMLFCLVFVCLCLQNSRAAQYQTIASGAWTEISTWDCSCVPNNLQDSVTIDHGVDLPTNNDIEINKLHIRTSGSLDINDNTIKLAGHFINEGTFDGGSGEVSFEGSSQQQLSGTNVFYDLKINNTAGVVITSGDQQVNHKLHLASGVFTTTGQSLTLISNSSSTAFVDYTGSGSITGDITVQRYVSGDEGWRFFATPVSGATIGDHEDDYTISGLTGCAYPNGGANVYAYDETETGDADNGWVALSHINDNLIVGLGYMCYIYDGDLPAVVDVSGTLNTGSQSLPVSYTSTPSSDDDGWNMVGNPYAAAIDWDASSGWTKANIDDAIYIWDPALQVYTSYVSGVGTNGGSRYIASSQCFWVKANASSPTLSMDEDVISDEDPTFFKTKPMENTLSVTIQGNGYADETVVRFMQNATDSFDRKLDAIKMFSGNTAIPNIYTIAHNKHYSINSQAELGGEVSIPLFLYINQPGSFTIKPKVLGEFPEGSCVMIEDMETGVLTDFYANDTIPLDVVIPLDGSSPRFTIHITPPPVMTVQNVSCNSAMDGAISIQSYTDTSWTYTLTGSNGNSYVFSNTVPNWQTLSGLGPDLYQLTVHHPKRCTRSFDITVEEPALVQALFAAPTKVILTEDPTVNFINESNGANTYLWHFGDGGQSTLPQPSYTYTDTGTYQVTLHVSNGGNCPDVYQQQLRVLQGPSLQTGLMATHSPTILLYPNPAPNGVVNLVATQLQGQEAWVNIFDLQGNAVYQQQVAHDGQGAMRRNFDLRQHLASGIYFMELKNDGQTIFKEKLVLP